MEEKLIRKIKKFFISFEYGAFMDIINQVFEKTILIIGLFKRPKFE